MPVVQAQKSQITIRSWPTPEDYSEAMQNLRLSMSDPELHAGTIVTDALGLPRVFSGAFASVYKVKCRQASYAVRCFLRDMPDCQRRYELIGKFVSACELPYTLPFSLLLEGVRIGGASFPLLKMQWAEGETLDNYLERTFEQPDTELPEKFRRMCTELRKAGIAHGDLQHGNIIVDDGELRLVDYDGMFVPAMKGMLSNELGHRNYQHPGRSAEQYDENIDNFSAWVIYISLKALAIDPSLYRRLGAGEDCLLFRREDFLNPLKSCAFACLEQHSSDEIRRMAQFLRAQLAVPPNAVRPIDANPELPQPLAEIDKSVATSRTQPVAVPVTAPGPGRPLPSPPPPPLGLTAEELARLEPELLGYLPRRISPVPNVNAPSTVLWQTVSTLLKIITLLMVFPLCWYFKSVIMGLILTAGLAAITIPCAIRCRSLADRLIAYGSEKQQHLVQYGTPTVGTVTAKYAGWPFCWVDYTYLHGSRSDSMPITAEQFQTLQVGDQVTVLFTIEYGLVYECAAYAVTGSRRLLESGRSSDR